MTPQGNEFHQRYETFAHRTSLPTEGLPSFLVVVSPDVPAARASLLRPVTVSPGRSGFWHSWNFGALMSHRGRWLLPCVLAPWFAAGAFSQTPQPSTGEPPDGSPAVADTVGLRTAKSKLYYAVVGRAIANGFNRQLGPDAIPIGVCRASQVFLNPSDEKVGRIQEGDMLFVISERRTTGKSPAPPAARATGA
jgi:hypothetical protein